MIIGNFTQQESGTFHGGIATFGLVQEVFIRAADPGRPGDPDYRIMLGDDGEEVVSPMEVGAAWKRHSPKTGKAYLSVKLDSPLLRAPINCALIENSSDQGGEFILVWSRKKTAADTPAIA